MNSGRKWSTLVDYFLVLSGIVGVGFASGKEICIFFYDFGAFSFIGLIAFSVLYIYLFWLIDYIRLKININSYNEFNKVVFGKLCKITNVAMVVNFVITSALMTSGADYVFSAFLGVGYRIPSIILSVMGFIVLLGGIDKIKIVANIMIPILIAVIVINSIKNINPSNVKYEIVGKNGFMAVYYAVLFGVNNFIVALPIIFETRTHFKSKFSVIISVVIIILCNLLVFGSNHFSSDMPMLELSKNVSNSFYYIYFVALCIAIVCTFIISLYNSYTICSDNKKSILIILFIIILNLFLSSFGYDFLVKYLYIISSVFSAIYVLIMLCCIGFVFMFKRKKLFDNQL